MKTRISRRKFVQTLSAGTVLAQLGVPLSARAAPRFEMAKILVGFTPGASADTTARRLAETLRGTYATNTIVENRSGAAGRIAIEALKSSPADGSVLLLSPITILTLVPHTTTGITYDPVNDLVPVSSAVYYTYALAVGPAVPDSVKTIKDFIKFAREKPALANYASPSPGAVPHLIGALLAKAMKVEMTHVGYRGIQPAMMALLSGEVAMFCAPTGDFLPHLAGGKIRLIATSGTERSSFAPDIPTFKEQGFDELTLREGYGFFLPKNTPRDIVNWANAQLRAGISSREYVNGVAQLGLEAVSSSPEELRNEVISGIKRWKSVVDKVGFTIQS